MADTRIPEKKAKDDAILLRSWDLGIESGLEDLMSTVIAEDTSDFDRGFAEA